MPKIAQGLMNKATINFSQIVSRLVWLSCFSMLLCASLCFSMFLYASFFALLCFFNSSSILLQFLLTLAMDKWVWGAK
jgi:hypothetical protein